MQDKAIAAIGALQLEKNKDLEPVDLYIENMFPGKDYQMLLLVFDITNNNSELNCEYKGIDIERVGQGEEGYRKYAYRKWSARGGDINFTTKISLPIDKKIHNIQINQFNKVLKRKGEEIPNFKLLKNTFDIKKDEITKDITSVFENFDRKQLTATGLSFRILLNGEKRYLRDFNVHRFSCT